MGWDRLRISGKRDNCGTSDQGLCVGEGTGGICGEGTASLGLRPPGAAPWHLTAWARRQAEVSTGWIEPCGCLRHQSHACSSMHSKKDEWDGHRGLREDGGGTTGLGFQRTPRAQ